MIKCPFGWSYFLVLKIKNSNNFYIKYKKSLNIRNVVAF